MGTMNGIPMTFSAKSAADLSAAQYVFVKFASGSTDANPLIELAASGAPCGILIKGEVAGRAMQVIPLNGQPAKLTASAAIGVGAYVANTTGGEGVAATADKAAFYFVATEAATAADDVISGYTSNGFVAV